MSWNDENFEISPVKDIPVMASWDDEFINDDDNDNVLLDSWDAEDSEENDKSKQTIDKSLQAQSAKKPKKSGEKLLLEVDKLDEKSRKEFMKKAELDSDLNNAASLFETLSVAEMHPREHGIQAQENIEALGRKTGFTKDTAIDIHPLFAEAQTKADYQDLRKALSVAITKMAEKSLLNYSSSLAVDLIRDVAKPLSIESIKQTVATLNVLIKEKERIERQARLAKVKGGTAIGGAGKKKAKTARPNLGGDFKKDKKFNLDNNDFSDFSDGDFM